MTTHYPIVLEREDSGDVSAYVAGLPIYAQAPTEARALKDIKAGIALYFQGPVVAKPAPRLRVASVRFKKNTPHVSLVSAAALVGARSSVRKAASSRANGKKGGRPRAAAAK